MSEALSADVSIATQEAYQNLTALLGAITSAENQLDKMAEAVKSADGRIGGLTKALNDAETQFKSTGAEADRTKMEDLRAALEQAKQRAATLRGEFGNLENQLKAVGAQETRTARDATAAGRQMVEASKRTGEAAEDAGKKTEDAQDKTKKKTKDSEDAFKGLGDAMIGVGASLFSLQKAVEVVKELEAHTKAVVEARIKLGDIKVGVDERIQAVIDNLGFLPGAAGQDRARGLVQGLQRRAPGVTAETAAEILARAQATGYKVADASRPDLDTKAPAFDIAAEVAKFSARQRLDADTAGKLFNIAQLSGVKTAQDMERLLSKMEMSFNEIAVTDPKELMRAAIQSSAGRISQGVSLEQALSQLAAAAVSQPDTARAATSVEQFTRVAAGTDPTKRQALAQVARQRGFITDAGLAQAQAEVAPTMKPEHVDAIEHSRGEIERAREARAREQRDAGNEAEKLAETARRLQADIDKLTKDLADPKKRKQTDQITQTISEKQFDLAETGRKAAEMQADQAQKEKDSAARIAEIGQRIAKLQSEDAKKLNDAALARAYQNLPLAARENLIWEASKGMTAQQLGVFASQIAEGDIAQELVKQLSPAARAARDRALAAGARPEVAGLRQRNAAFQTNTLAQKSATEIAAEQAATAAMQPGTEFFNNAFTLAKRDIEILQSKGEGQTGFFAAARDQLGKPTPTRAGTSEMLQARRLILIVRDQFYRFLQSSDPKTHARFSGRIGELYRRLEALIVSVHRPEGALNSGVDRFFEVQGLAQDIGALIADMQKSALESGETPGLSGPAGLDLPSNRSGFGYADPTFTPEQLGQTGPRASAADLPGAGSGVLNPAGGGFGAGGGPVASAGPTYNINVSTLVSQGAESFDLPARLGVPDLS